MGNQEAWGHPSHVLLNGLLPNEVASATRVLDSDRWSIAEGRIADLIQKIQPNLHSEERRNAVANYVQRLIMKCFSCQVFTFGSVPLKTYLPDGDIDMTAFSNNLTLKDTWANEVRNMLENEEKSENAEFRVKEVQYIQAEVKIIKCLVENIVVDISFNQLGGLCTLCFLEEIDQFINQDHLFKRSIILIKAWCYYESRILGAHHGLISTYALEILVLYIFHVFNNSFSGPLEVLYRFLEFFSNFDWDNFCVSLWGPVPISSLPDIAAEPPRKDNGRLLLRKEFLDACSSRYSVFPGGQENQGQPFVSKFFNVIDPLRTNNNLGRSVSKGNFHRIRSAFAFGAKRLAVLLECPKGELVAEVNKFFTNTWKRHGVGPRPDAPNSDLWNVSPSNSGGPVEESEKPRIHLGTKGMSENAGSLVARDHQTDGSPSQGLGTSSHSVTTVNQSSQNMYRSGSSSTTSHSHNRKVYGNQTGSRVPDQMERNISSSEPVQNDKDQKSLRSEYVSGEHLASRIQFARTRSSPELSHTSSVSNQRQPKVPERTKNQIAYSRPEQTGRKKSSGLQTSGGPSVRSSSIDPLSLKQSSSNQSLDVAGDSICSSNSYEDAGFVTRGEEFATISDVLDMQQEEQDLVNMMASSRLSNFNGQLHFPMNIPSAHIPLPLSPSMLASMGFSQRNLAGILPGNIPLIKPPWGSVVQFSHGLASPQLPNYLHNAGLGSNQEETLEVPTDSSSMTEMNPEDDHGFWQDQDTGSVRVLGPESGNFQMIHSDDKQMPPMRINSSSSSGGNSSTGSFAMGQHQLFSDDKLARGDFSDGYQHQTSAGQDTYSSDRIANLRFVQASSSRSRPPSRSSWDGPSSKVSKVGRDKRGRKTTTSASSPYGESKGGWQYDDSSPDNRSVPGEDENKDWIPLSMMGTDVVERSVGSASLVPPAHSSGHSGHHLSGYDPAQMSGSDAAVPIAPMLVSSGSRPRTGDGNGVMPITFYPTGPPVPFLTMLPLCNFPAEPGSSDRSTNRLDNGHMNPSDKNFDSEDNEQLEGQLSPGSIKCSSYEHPEELKPDILNSDFSSHWQNLQYGRLCQNTRYPGPPYPSPVVIPPLYLQGHFPWDGPGRPLSANMNMFTQIAGYGPRLVPVAPLQPGQSRPSTVFQQYGDDIPRYRGGTGTYLPNPKVSYRDRQSPRARGHRGNYNYERNDHIDREGSWINSKSRATGRSHGRNQTEKPSPRSDRFSLAESRSDRPWDSYRNEPMANYQNQLGSFSSSNKHGSVNMAHGVYPLPTVNSNGMNSSGPGVPSVVMLYSYDPSATYAPSSEQLEFGSLGPVQLFGLSEAPQPTDGGPVRVVFEQRQGAYQQVSPQSSPDQPSSPQVHKRAI